MYFHRELEEEEEEGDRREGRLARDRRPPTRFRDEEGYEFRDRDRRRNSSSSTDSGEDQAIALPNSDIRSDDEQAGRVDVSESELEEALEDQPVEDRRTGRNRRPTRRYIEEM